jgi:hypothetical protein
MPLSSAGEPKLNATLDRGLRGPFSGDGLSSWVGPS